MSTIVKEGLISFKELEQKVFKYVCELGCGITRAILESYDKELAAARDSRQYRDKGSRKTSIKTVYGEVEYCRRVYRTSLEDGKKAYVYLLDEAMGMDRIGLISTNLAEKIALPRCGRRHKRYLRPEHQRRRRMEYDAASGGKDQRRGRTCGKADERRPVGRDKGNTGAF